MKNGGVAVDEQALRQAVEAIVREFEEEARALDTGGRTGDPAARLTFDRGRQGGIRSVVFALKARVLGISKIS